MIYPEFLKPGDTIGVCAPSEAIGRKLESYETSINVLKRESYTIQETAHVRINDRRGGDAKTRAEELLSLFKDPKVNMVACAAGGDFLYEMLAYTDFEEMKKHPKWLMGMSDPTGLLFPYTVMCDVATLYGKNACQYDVLPVPEFTKENLSLLRGELPVLHSAEKWLGKATFMVDEITYDEPTDYHSSKDSINVTGRCLGGCIDVLKDLIGTPLAPVPAFIEKYKEDGQIFFFDNFAMSAENMYRTLLQMKLAGWFKYTKLILLGRVCLPSSETGMSYDDALRMALDDIPWISEADIGHTLPNMTIINGAIMHVDYKDRQAEISFELK